MNLPNKLTLLRIILIIPIIILFFVFWWWNNVIEKNDLQEISLNSKSFYFLYAIGILFIISMISDFFDGYIARKKNLITDFGKLFDPLADKIMINITMIFLGIFNYTYIVLVIIFIIRDLIVDGARNLMASKNLKFEANIWGKIKTIFQSIAIPLIIFLVPIINTNIWWELFLINIPLIFATLASIISGILYFKQIIPYLKDSR